MYHLECCGQRQGQPLTPLNWMVIWKGLLRAMGYHGPLDLNDKTCTSKSQLYRSVIDNLLGRVNPLSEILDPGTTSSVDIVRLRKLCSRGMSLFSQPWAYRFIKDTAPGIPDEPGWLRPRIWK